MEAGDCSSKWSGQGGLTREANSVEQRLEEGEGPRHRPVWKKSARTGDAAVTDPEAGARGVFKKSRRPGCQGDARGARLGTEGGLGPGPTGSSRSLQRLRLSL